MPAMPMRPESSLTGPPGSEAPQPGLTPERSRAAARAALRWFVNNGVGPTRWSLLLTSVSLMAARSRWTDHHLSVRMAQ
jgi:hypothetical protein